MPDTDQKVDIKEGIQTPPETQVSIIDNPATTSLAPQVLECKVYANAKTNLVIPERVVLALGGKTAFKTEVTGLGTLKYMSGRALDKEVTDDGAAKIEPQLPGEFISTEQKGQTRGRAYKMMVKPYDWGRTTKFDWVTFRAPTWITILAIRWFFWNWLVDPNASIPGGGLKVGRRIYPLREIKDDEFKTADLN